MRMGKNDEEEANNIDVADVYCWPSLSTAQGWLALLRTSRTDIELKSQRPATRLITHPLQLNATSSNVSNHIASARFDR